jgi:hypothetical protein
MFASSCALNCFARLLLIRRPCSPEDDEEVKARCHYRSAKVDNIVYTLGDDVYVKVIAHSFPLPSFLALLLLLLGLCARDRSKRYLISVVDFHWCYVMVWL